MSHANVPLMFPIDLEGAPKILVAGREWSIPKLAPKQARHVVPALMGMLPLVARVQAAATTGGDGTQIDSGRIMDAMAGIDEETFRKLETAVFWALRRGYPQLGQGEFEEMPMDLFEMLNALPVIMRQTGFIKQRSGSDPAGEVQAIDQSTGTS